MQGRQRFDPAVYVHAGVANVIVPARVCAQLEHYAGLDDFRIQSRGHDAELDAVLVAMHAAAAAWRGSAIGTREAVEPEPDTDSTWLTTAQVASRLGITDRGVRKAIQQQQLSATKTHEGHWRISREDLAFFRSKQ